MTSAATTTARARTATIMDLKNMLMMSINILMMSTSILMVTTSILMMTTRPMVTTMIMRMDTATPTASSIPR